ncbi:hypothetical protein FA15DRAFT_683571 [Coprinopsis marcescibilis]|uniref:Uncharacterized protein n=1 Tax=Coprinopsis marcescibilis TaxID=230819 RepID=A0A5C3KB13_COPMA|nr:hypothetical protein FA15DRAFT_683571 [Coprinopsis marcescibilis]
MKEILLRVWKQSSQLGEVECGPFPAPGRRIIVWFHDETIFYAHDMHCNPWHHKDAQAKPYTKGEGYSLMIADFVSADFGWLSSNLCSVKKTAQKIIRPGKGHDMYSNNDDIIDQFIKAVQIVKEAYPDFEHVFVYDNATTHLKRFEDSISAQKMPKGCKDINRKCIHVIGKNGTLMSKKKTIPMADAQFADRRPQRLYYDDGSNQGKFNGMLQILEEQGFHKKVANFGKLNVECKKFKCPEDKENCCLCHILYNQPDFANGKSKLEIVLEQYGMQVLLLPKFHCELNFIEQVWGYAKQVYQLNEESLQEDVLEWNALAALDSLPLLSMQHFANQALQFMNACDQGLTGAQAA